MMRFEVERAREWFGKGLPLVGKVDRELAIDLELFSRGGPGNSERHRDARDYAVLGRRPAISKTRKLALVARAALGSCYEHRRAARASPVFADRIATGDGLLGLPQHHAHGGQEFLLRVSGACPKPSGRRCARSMPSCGAATTLPTTPSFPLRERRQKLADWLDAFHRAVSRDIRRMIPCCWP